MVEGHTDTKTASDADSTSTLHYVLSI